MADITVRTLVDQLDLQVGAGADRLDEPVTGGYASDLLSCVMAGAQAGDVWVTLQAHMNVVAVAALLDLAAVVITEGAQPDASTLRRADERHIPVLMTEESTFGVVARLAALGVTGSR
jgi:predicted transcriptional regulator